MATQTSNLGLTKPGYDEAADVVPAVNNNMDTLDSKIGPVPANTSVQAQITSNTQAIGNLANLTTTEKGSLVGAANELNSNIAQKQDILTRPLCSSDVIEYGPFQSTAGQEQPLITASTYVPAGKQFAGVQKVFFAGANDIDKAGTLTWANDGVVFAVPTLSQPNVYVKLVVLYF